MKVIGAVVDLPTAVPVVVIHAVTGLPFPVLDVLLLAVIVVTVVLLEMIFVAIVLLGYDCERRAADAEENACRENFLEQDVTSGWSDGRGSCAVVRRQKYYPEGGIPLPLFLRKIFHRKDLWVDLNLQSPDSKAWGAIQGMPAKLGVREWYKGREENGMTDGVVKVEEIQLPRIRLRMLIDGEGSGASLTMFEMEVAPGGAMPIPHYHVAFDETVHCTAGRLRMMRDGQTVDVGGGETVFVPRGMVHAFENPFEETAKVLVVITPGVFGAPYFREMRELMAAGWPPDPKMAAEVMKRHGLVPVRPSAG